MVTEVLPDVPYLQIVFTLPKMLRKHFLFERALYGELAKVAYAATREFFAAQFPSIEKPIPAMIVAPQSFGSLLNPHAHLHSGSSLGGFDQEGTFHAAPHDLDFTPLEERFFEKTLSGAHPQDDAQTRGHHRRTRGASSELATLGFQSQHDAPGSGRAASFTRDWDVITRS